MSFGIVIVVAVTASLIGDSIWFYLGWRRGATILALIYRVTPRCRISSSRMNSLLKKYGPSFLSFSKFVPGLGMLVPPITGAMKVEVWYFLLLDAGGALAWATAYVLTGRVLCPHLDYLRISSASSNLVFGVAVLALAALGWGTIQLRPARMWGKLRQRCSFLYADLGRFCLMLSPAGTGPSARACDLPPFRRERVSRAADFRGAGAAFPTDGIVTRSNSNPLRSIPVA
jgi:membrane protein DedA with SNARE-associated domain